MARHDNPLVAMRELQRAADDGDVAAVVHVLREYPEHEVLQYSGLCALLLAVSPGDVVQPVPAQLAVEAGALAVAVAALRTFGSSADLQVSAGHVLARLAQCFPAEAAASGAIEAAVTGMRNHTGNFEVQLAWCAFLFKVAAVCNCEDSALYASRVVVAHRNAHRAGEAGAVAVVLATLRAHGSRHALEGGDFELKALDALLALHENARRALRAGALSLCIRALRNAGTSQNEQQQPHSRQMSRPLRLVVTLGILVSANPAGTAAQAGELGVVEVVTGPLIYHNVRGEAGQMLYNGCSLLQMLMEHHKPNTQRAWRTGALLPQLQGVLDRIQERGPTAEELPLEAVLIAVVGHMRAFEADANAAADAAAAELLAEEAARPAAAAAQKKKKNKKKQAPQPQQAVAHVGDAQPAVPPEDGASAAGAEPERECVICLDAPPCVMLLPCKHLLLCAAPECRAALRGRCPLCREEVADTLAAFTL